VARSRIPKPIPRKSDAQNRRKPKPVVRLAFSERVARLWEHSFVRAGGLRRAGAALLHVLSIACVVAGGLSVCRLVDRHLRTSPSFAIKTIEVKGNQHLTAAAVMQAAGLAIGQNVLAVGPEEARQRLSQVPFIEFVSVKRRLPGTFVIELRERQPVALLSLTQLYLVSDDGVAFKPLEPGEPFDLPVISGIDVSETTQDEHVDASSLLRAVALLHDYRDAGLARAEPISEIHVENDGGLSLYIGADATYVRLGKPPFRQKLERLREVIAHLARQKARAAYVYLDNQRRVDRVTARLR
jgi:cell division protein FtsQ